MPVPLHHTQRAPDRLTRASTRAIISLTRCRTLRASLVGLVVATGLGLGLPALASAQPADAEPNDTISTAGGPLREGITYEGALQTPQDIDLYRVYVSRAKAQLQLTAVNPTPTPADSFDIARWNLSILNARGEETGTDDGELSVNNGETGTLAYSFPGAGTYFIRLQQSNITSAPGAFDYTLTLQGGGRIIGYDPAACTAARRAKTRALTTVRKARTALRKARREHAGVKTRERRLASLERTYRASKTRAIAKCRA